MNFGDVFLSKLKQYSKDGYIRESAHPFLPLWIYNYTPKTSFEEKWDEITLNARGLIIGWDIIEHEFYTCIQGPKKFFNKEEKWSAKFDISKSIISEKLDGYYISIKLDPRLGLVISSRGSFCNKYTEAAEKLITEPIRQQIRPNIQYFCELLQDFPEDAGIIVTKHTIPSLVCWAMRGEDGKEIIPTDGNCPFEVARKMTFEESIETTKIHSVAGILDKNEPFVSTRPFRSPHHTVSAPALSGGGSIPKPGELSLAHNGVLFLDEVPEFPKTVTDSLRQPLEYGKVTITRASGRVTYPCSFMLVAAMNPCRCGYFGHPTRPCSCSHSDVKRYISKISGPMLDRIDIQVELPSLPFEEISGKKGKSESSRDIRKRVIKARAFMRERLAAAGIDTSRYFCNGQLDAAATRKTCMASDEALSLMSMAFEKLGLSGRGYDRILRLARTVADLDGSEMIEAGHIAEAISLRSLDKKYWS